MKLTSCAALLAVVGLAVGCDSGSTGPSDSSYAVTITVTGETTGNAIQGIDIEVAVVGSVPQPFCTTGASGTCTAQLAGGPSYAFGCDVCFASQSEPVFTVGNLSSARIVPLIAADELIFSEDFEGSLLAAGWLGREEVFANTSAEIIFDPANPSNRVVRFNETRAGGDAFSPPIQASVGEEYRVAFDFRGSPTEESFGFLGYADGWPGDHTWLAGSRLISGAFVQLIDDGTWQSYSIRFDPNPLVSAGDQMFQVMIEDGDGGPAGDALFDNIRVYRLR